MKFNKSTILYNINSIPVIGNYDTGSLIGLTPEGKNFCASIFENGITDDMVDEKNKELFAAMKAAGFFEGQEKSGINSAYLHVTQRCNLHCIGCYSLDDKRNCLKDASAEQIKRAFSQLSENGCNQIVISGGEPFLRADLAELLEYAHDTAHVEHISIITNGTALTYEKVMQVKPYIDSIAVSVDGYSEDVPTFIRDEGIFEKIMEAVKICKEAGVKVSILPTIHTKNCNFMREYVALSKKLNVEISYSLLTCSPKDEFLKNWLPDSEQLSGIARDLIDMGIEEAGLFNDMPIGNGVDTRKSCEVGNKIVSIGADGTVYPCHMLHDDKLAMGNIFEEDLSDILSSEIARECRELHVDNFETCGDCRHKYICGGGCRARSFYVYGNLQSHDFYCPMTKTYFDWISDKLEDMYNPA